jgi:N-acetylmuramoyl-L-alanine amidase
MRRIATILMILLLLAGCTHYVSVSEVGDRVGGRVRSDEDPQQATVSGSGNEIVVQSGSSLVFINGRAVLLNRAARVENGQLKVSDEIFRFLPERRCEQPVRKPAVRRPRHVVIDPGHGGRDTGAAYAGVYEKNVNLDVARMVAAELRRQGMQVTMTRNEDTFVTLERRSETANRVQPDMFVSIHANAASQQEANGIEVFYLAETFTQGEDLFDDVGRAAELESRRLSTTGRTGPAAAAYSVSPELLNRRRTESMELARSIEREMQTRLGVPSRGVKSASYEVLRWTCPAAVLVEVGFLSNPAERRRIADAGYRRSIASAIAAGVVSYCESSDRTRDAGR